MKSNATNSLEPRVTAMLHGEASPFEKAVLAEALAADPALADFSRSAASLDRLLQQALAPSEASDMNKWRLSPERRAALAAQLGLPARKGEPRAGRVGNPNGSRPAFWLAAPWFAPAAAALIFMLGAAGLGWRMLVPSISGALEKAERKSALSSRISDPRSMSESTSALSNEGESRDFSDKLALYQFSEAPVISGADELSESMSRTEDLSSSALPPPGAMPAPAAPADLGVAMGTGAGGRAMKTKRRQDGKAPFGGDVPVAGRLFASESEPPAPGRDVPLGRLTPSEMDFKDAGSAQAGEKSERENFDGSIHYGAPYTARQAAAGERRRSEVAKADKPVALFEKQTSAGRTSTFSLHVSDVSFRLAAESILERNQPPPPESVRVEEFTAAFDYGDPAPAGGEPVALAQSQSAHPFIPESNLLRVSLRAAAAGREGGRPLNFTILLDKSGSMERPDRAGAARAAAAALAKKLSPEDRVTLLTFDREARLVADSLPGSAALEVLRSALAAVGESGTNLETAMAAAFDAARARFDPAAINRLLLITDGVANLGEIVPESLARPVADLRASGIALDVVAAGARGVGDRVLETIARDGDGRYFLLENGEADADGFAEKLAGAFRPAAKNVKIQIRFNPERVAEWSLLGFDEHRLREEDFRNDAIDAAELSAAEQGSALYQIRFRDGGRGEVGQISVRFQEMSTGRMVERTWVIPWQPMTPAFDLATPAHQLAGLATLLAEKLRGSPTGQLVQLSELSAAAARVRERFGQDEKARRLLDMIERLRSIEGG